MTLGERLDEILAVLPGDWSEARLVLTVTDPAQAGRAAELLGPLGPGRTGATFRLAVSRTGAAGPSADTVRRALDRLEAEGLDARLSLPGTAAFQVLPREEHTRRSLAEGWDAAVAALPPDWSDLYVELDLASSTDVDNAALQLAPVNPFLHEGVPPAFRFRVARAGYGAAAGMARRCLERLDAEGIAGTVRILRVQCETEHVLTQGPVWRDGGRAI